MRQLLARGERVVVYDLVPTLVAALERHKELLLPPEGRAQGVSLSPATLDRLLRPGRRRLGRQPHRAQAPGATLTGQIPLRTFGELQDVAPGSLQGDLVLHCGESNAGFYLATLVAVDVATSWTELEALWGLGKGGVRTGVHHVRQHLPFPGNAFDSALFALLGDFNDQPMFSYLKPLVQDLGLENVVDRLSSKERWTHWWASRNRVSQLDYILLSPAISRLTEGQTPYIERRGLGYTEESASGGILPRKTRLIRSDDDTGQELSFDFERFPDVSAEIEASEHCPVFLEVP